MSHYETLGVPREADAKTIKRAYRRKASAAHTDRGGGSHELMVAVNRAYQTLGDPEKRQHYDKTGQDQGTVSDEAHAADILMQVFIQIAEKCDESTDLVTAVRGELETHVGNMEQKRSEFQGKTKRLAAHRKRLKRTKAGNSPLDNVLEQRLQLYGEKVAELSQLIARAKMAIDMAGTYRYEAKARSEAVNGMWVIVDTAAL